MVEHRTCIQRYTSLAIVLAAIIITPGCWLLDLFTEKKTETERLPIESEVSGTTKTRTDIKDEVPDDGSKVLASINGRPIVTEKSLEQIKKEFLESDPSAELFFKQASKAEIDRTITDLLVNKALINQAIADKKIDQKSDYKQELDRAIRNTVDMLNATWFGREIDVNVSEAEARDYYDKNKEKFQALKRSPGGIKASGVSFEDEKSAKDFLAKVKEARGDIKKAAEAAGLTPEKVQDFGQVNIASRGLAPALREKVSSIQIFPASELIKVDDKTFWVVHATGKEEAKYIPFEEVKEDFIQMLTREKKNEAYAKELDKLKQQYKVIVTLPELPMMQEQEGRQQASLDTETKVDMVPVTQLT